MDGVIEDLNQITPEWLTDLLRSAGVLKQGSVRQVDKTAGPPAASAVFHLAVTYTPDAPKSAPLRLVLKIPRTGDEHRMDREAEFYSWIAPEMVGLPILRCYAAAFSPASGRYNLLLEDLSGTHFPHSPSQLPPLQGSCEQIVDAVAALHARWWDDPGLGKEIGELPVEELTAYSKLVEQTFPQFADFLGDRLSPERRIIYETVLPSLTSLQARRLADGVDLTLVHGDIHIGNFLYPYDPQAETVRFLDWKTWGVGLGAEDLAHMMAVFWFPERRARLERVLLERYHARLLEHGIRGYGWEALWRDYRLSVIGFLGYPVWQWAHGVQADIWWHHLERIFLAYQDLSCATLLES